MGKTCNWQDALCGMTPLGCVLKVGVSSVADVNEEIRKACRKTYPAGSKSRRLCIAKANGQFSDLDQSQVFTQQGCPDLRGWVKQNANIWKGSTAALLEIEEVV